MRQIALQGEFEAWRGWARQLLAEGVPPDQVTWQDGAHPTDLFAGPAAPTAADALTAPLRLPRRLLDLLRDGARFRAEDRWAFLYRLLWRYAHGDGSALLAGDPDGSRLHRRLRQVRQEEHRMKAFLRFRSGRFEGQLRHMAWFEPRHRVLDRVAEHFADRMGDTPWAIATPDGAALGDGGTPRLLEPCPAALAQAAQASAKGHDDDPWLAYYGSTFNPTRLNPGLMQRHMPSHLWRHLPEASLFAPLIREARLGGRRAGQAAALAERPGHRIRAPRAPDEAPDQ